MSDKTNYYRLWNASMLSCYDEATSVSVRSKECFENVRGRMYFTGPYRLSFPTLAAEVCIQTDNLVPYVYFPSSKSLTSCGIADDPSFSPLERRDGLV